MALVNKTKILIKASIVSLMLVFICVINCYAAEYTLCNGKEFNRRVISFLNDGDKNRIYDFSITLFNKGNNPPDDPTYYVDVSEDNDGSVIVYKHENELCWYSDYYVSFPKDASFMFENFMNLRNCDLTGFTFLNGISDTRYMFSNCRRLTRFRFGTPPPKEGCFELSETQGMFFNCQSIQNIDLSNFGFMHVENMSEMFYRCFNLRNIYVSKIRWKLENLINCNKIFSECHSLRTNNGRKAVDINPDDYEKYLIAGSDSVEGFLKDNMTTYSDYGENLETVMIEDKDYISIQHETTVTYADEPEMEGVGGSDEARAGKTSGGSINIEEPVAEKEIIETQIVKPTEIETFVVETETIEPEVVKPEEVKEPIIVELEPTGGAPSKKGGIFEYDTDHSRFIVFALIISIIVILLLVGMVVYLYKEAKPKEKQRFQGE